MGLERDFEVQYFWEGKTYANSLQIRVIKRLRVTGFTKTVLQPYTDSLVIHLESLNAALTYECLFETYTVTATKEGNTLTCPIYSQKNGCETVIIRDSMGY